MGDLLCFSFVIMCLLTFRKHSWGLSSPTLRSINQSPSVAWMTWFKETRNVWEENFDVSPGHIIRGCKMAFALGSRLEWIPYQSDPLFIWLSEHITLLLIRSREFLHYRFWPGSVLSGSSLLSSSYQTSITSILYSGLPEREIILPLLKISPTLFWIWTVWESDEKCPCTHGPNISRTISGES